MCVICYKCTQQCAHTLSQRSVKSWASFVTSIFYQVTLLPSFTARFARVSLPLPRLLILLMIILLFFPRFFFPFQPLLYLYLVIFVTPDATSTKVAYPVLCEIRRKRVRATRGEITEEQREVKTRLERERREEGTEGWVMKWKEKGVKGGTSGA